MIIDLTQIPKEKAMQVELAYTRILFKNFWILLLGDSCEARRQQRIFMRSQLQDVRKKYRKCRKS